MGLKVCVLGFLLATDLLSVPLPHFPGPECEWPSSLCSSDVLLCLFSLNFTHFSFSVIFCFSACCVLPLFFSFLLLTHRLFIILLEFHNLNGSYFSWAVKASLFYLLFGRWTFPPLPMFFIPSSLCVSTIPQLLEVPGIHPLYLLFLIPLTASLINKERAHCACFWAWSDLELCSPVIEVSCRSVSRSHCLVPGGSTLRVNRSTEK